MIKEAGAGLLKTFIILLVIVFFGFSFVGAAIIILLSSLLIKLYGEWKGGFRSAWQKRTITSLGVTLLILSILYGINHYLGAYTILAFFIVVFFISGLILYTKREEYLTIVRHAEKTIWGATAEERREQRRKKK